MNECVLLEYQTIKEDVVVKVWQLGKHDLS